mmetsp:Transcript_24650/g.63631  ORF Transcript_24650/g.63631 Transcript_24650/m.63631 type:complete len:92 (+) Transcript_24650:397-672(+)
MRNAARVCALEVPKLIQHCVAPTNDLVLRDTSSRPLPPAQLERDVDREQTLEVGHLGAVHQVHKHLVKAGNIIRASLGIDPLSATPLLAVL